MIGVASGEIRKVIGEWKKEVVERRRVTSVDPVADTFAYCAADLEERLRQAEVSGKPLSTREYASAHGVLDSTVRKWIARGELDAVHNPSGDWEIPRSAIRRRVKAAAKVTAK